jgi:hypothetical protein
MAAQIARAFGRVGVESARPHPVDQYPLAVAGCGRIIGSLQLDIGGGFPPRGTAPTAKGAVSSRAGYMSEYVGVEGGADIGYLAVTSA